LAHTNHGDCVNASFLKIGICTTKKRRYQSKLLIQKLSLTIKLLSKCQLGEKFSREFFCPLLQFVKSPVHSNELCIIVAIEQFNWVVTDSPTSAIFHDKSTQIVSNEW
jgi:hypothetical protein